MNKEKQDIVLTTEQIKEICERLGKEITRKVKGDKKPPIIVGVLKGAVPFMMDLIKYVDTTIITDFIQIKSYEGTTSTGKVQLLKDISFDCEDRTVIIVEDIVDTGCSMSFLIKHFKSHNPKRVLVCTLFNKSEARKIPVKIDFVGHELVGNHFLIGYGLDYNEVCRNLPYVFNATKKDIDELDTILK